MTYSVVSVSTKRQMRDFLALPHLIYRNDPNWVPPLRSEVRRVLDEKRNPYFADAMLKLFVCSRNDVPAARVAIIVNRRHQEKFGQKSAFFGFFESIDDPEAVARLFEAAEEHARNQGAEILEGPFNPNHYSEVGLQVDQFGTPPTFFQPYNPASYNDLLRNIGFHVSATFHTRKNGDIRRTVRDRFGTQAPRDVMGEYTIRSLSANDLEADLERFREVNNSAFSSNWHFLPLSREEYLFSAKYLRLVTFLDLVKIVEHKGEPVGILHCVLDINPALRKLKGRAGPIRFIRFLGERKKIKTLIIFSVGIKKSHQHGRPILLLFEAFRRMCEDYERVETTWMSDENALAVRAANHFDLKPDKHFAVYEKRLSGRTA